MAFIQKLSQFRTPVSTYTNLPVSGNVKGDIRITTDTGTIYICTADAGVDAYTKLLLHLDNNIVDSETTPKTVTNCGGVSFSSSIKKLGTHSASFNGVSEQAGLTVPLSSDFQFGTGDFTVECWINFNSLSSDTNYICVMGQNIYDPWWALMLRTSDKVLKTMGTGGYVPSLEYTWSTVTTGTWYHLAITRSGNTFRMFINGNIVSYVDAAVTLPGASNFQIGCGGATQQAYNLNGYMDEVRVSKGIARWTSNFIPPTTPYITGSLSDWQKVTSSDYNDLSGSPYSSGLAIDTAVNIITDLSVNIAILAWQNLTSFGASLVKMFDGVLNQFTYEETGMQLDHCANQVLKTDDDITYYYEPTASTNMTLQSVGYVTNDVPTSARIVILEQDIDIVNENTDLLVYLSRDGGTTFSAVTITKDSSYGDGTLNIFTGSVSLTSQPSGSLMVWKLVTQNHKDCKMLGIALNWKS